MPASAASPAIFGTIRGFAKFRGAASRRHDFRQDDTRSDPELCRGKIVGEIGSTKLGTNEADKRRL
jgi:hypothetical protein